MRKSKDIKKLKVKAAQAYKKGDRQEFQKIWDNIHKQYADLKNQKKEIGKKKEKKKEV